MGAKAEYQDRLRLERDEARAEVAQLQTSNQDYRDWLAASGAKVERLQAELDAEQAHAEQLEHDVAPTSRLRETWADNDAEHEKLYRAAKAENERLRDAVTIGIDNLEYTVARWKSLSDKLRLERDEALAKVGHLRSDLAIVATAMYFRDHVIPHFEQYGNTEVCPQCHESLMYMPNDCETCNRIGAYVTDASIAAYGAAMKGSTDD